jgi:hypothetical protein
MQCFADIQVYAGMADFQHVVPVHAAEGRKRKRLGHPNVEDDLGSGRLLSDFLSLRMQFYYYYHF